MVKHFIGSFDTSLIKNMDEFRKRYESTYLFLSDEQYDTELVHVDSVHFDHVSLNTAKGVEITVSRNTNSKLEVIWPDFRLINTDRNVSLCARYPLRQWKRAPTYETVRFTYITDKFQYKNVNTSLFTLINTAVKDKSEYTLSEAINILLNSDRIGFALNKQWALLRTVKGINPNEYILFFYNNPCAIINYSKKTILCKNNFLFQEIMDYVKYKENNSWLIK